MPRHRTSEKHRPVEEGVPSSSNSGQSDTDSELMMAKSQGVLVRLPGVFFSQLHTIFAIGAFVTALIVACYTHFDKIVRNQYYGYPDEWFPSVSAATGDRYPARSIFQIIIALAAGPRFAILSLWYLHASSKMNYPSTLAKTVFGIGLIRTVACGVFVYITSTDDHDIHDIGMLLYILCTFPYMIGTIWHERRLSGVKVQHAVKWRKRLGILFGASLGPLAYFFIQHKVHKVKGAYSFYALFEWSLIFYDIAFDACSAWCFSRLQVLVMDTGRATERSASSMINSSSVGSNIASITGWPLVQSWLSSVTTSESVYFAADVYLGYVFWSLLTAVPLAIWYFPLWHMGLSGDELYLFANMGAVLLGIPIIRRLACNYRGIFHLVTVLTLAAYHFPAPEHRLYFTAGGSFLACIAWFSSFSAHTSDRDAYSWLLGLIASCVAKAAWRTNNPIWPIMNPQNGGWNMTGLLVGVAASTIAIYRDYQFLTSSRPSSVDIKTAAAKESMGRSSWARASIGFGALLFALHTVFSDSTTPLRWAVDGYPHLGAQPVPWGFLVLVAMCGGLNLAQSRLTLLPGWSIFGIISIFTFSAASGWLSFIGGLGFAVFLFSVAPNIILSLGAQPLGRSLAVALLAYNVLMLAHVWTVAYEFVPGGPLLRERTWIVMTVMAIALNIGFLSASARPHLNLYSYEKQHPQIQQAYEQRRRSTGAISKITSITLCALGALAYLSRVQLQTPQSYTPAEHRAFTAGIWTIHFGIDNDMWASEERMRAAIEELGIDVIGLLESDLQRIITGNRDLTQSLGEVLNMYTDYGPASSKHTWGCTMLSKFPIKRSSHHLLPSPDGELACAIYATLDVYGTDVDVIVSHNGQDENLLDRRLQTTELARIASTSKNPIVFLGYVVSKPFGEIYNILMGEGKLNDVDPTDWDRWCEYIGFRGLKRLAYARISHGGITDTEIQSAKFQLFDTPHCVEDDIAEANRRHHDNLAAEEDNRVPLGNYVPESNIPTALHYPAQFRNDGLRGHRYHVFDEPRYFD
ncbi:Frag1/DRAM/Sfk1 family-domain-containing protein [Syncephalis fuscata]|nr:Frag1/DRAM/Sfk1 family-domain-containing protein [Syncephalis fuscata]